MIELSGNFNLALSSRVAVPWSISGGYVSHMPYIAKTVQLF